MKELNLREIQQVELNNLKVIHKICQKEKITCYLAYGTLLGAGSVVTKNIPDHATAAGNYARVLNFNNPGRYILNKWIHS